MHKSFLLMAFGLLATCGSVLAKDFQTRRFGCELTNPMFLVTGLHGPSRTTAIERSLAKEKGPQSIIVNWRTLRACAAFDETKLSAQEVANLIAQTPHITGGKLHSQSCSSSQSQLELD